MATTGFEVSFGGVVSEPRVRRSTMIAERIKAMLLTGELKPGQRLPTEAELGKVFNVSRTTLREAIQMLRVSGLLDVTPGRGSFVKVPDIRRAMEDLALYGACSKIEEARVNRLRLSFERDLLAQAVLQPTAKRNQLYDYMLRRDADGAVNAELEAGWHLHMAELGGGEMARLMLEALLKMQRHSRMAALNDTTERERVLTLQVRLTNAIIDGDVELGQRVLTAYLGGPIAQKLPQAA